MADLMEEKGFLRDERPSSLSLESEAWFVSLFMSDWRSLSEAASTPGVFDTPPLLSEGDRDTLLASNMFSPRSATLVKL
jgi:hypothetical protein